MVHCIEGAAILLGGTGFYFDKNQLIMPLVPAHEIEFASMRSTKITIENLVPVLAQIPGSQLFTKPPKCNVRGFLRGRKKSVAPPAQSCGDGSGRGHAPAV